MQPLYRGDPGSPILAAYKKGCPVPFPFTVDVLGDGACMHGHDLNEAYKVSYPYMQVHSARTADRDCQRWEAASGWGNCWIARVRLAERDRSIDDIHKSFNRFNHLI